jgi:hypothetical protein
MAKLKRGRSTDASDGGFEEQDVDVPKVKKAKNVKVSKNPSSATGGKNEKGEPYWEVGQAIDNSQTHY